MRRFVVRRSFVGGGVAPPDNSSLGESGSKRSKFYHRHDTWDSDGARDRPSRAATHHRQGIYCYHPPLYGGLSTQSSSPLSRPFLPLEWLPRSSRAARRTSFTPLTTSRTQLTSARSLDGGMPTSLHEDTPSPTCARKYKTASSPSDSLKRWKGSPRRPWCEAR